MNTFQQREYILKYNTEWEEVHISLSSVAIDYQGIHKPSQCQDK